MTLGPPLTAACSNRGRRHFVVRRSDPAPPGSGSRLHGAPRTILMLVAISMLGTALPALAQTPGPASGRADRLVVHPFFLFSGENFAASQTFDAAFGDRTLRPFLGAGVQVRRRNIFVEVAISRFSAEGQRVFVSGGEVFPLGIPLETAVTPLELTIGYRYPLTRTIAPYAGVGIGRYWYSETSGFSEPGEDVAESHAGFLVAGGAEFRLHRWVGVAVDAQYTHVTGILGADGISRAFGEDNLGGTAVRVKILVGR
jgi:hypothetical protein